jgi:hypothetical protein
MTKIDKGRVVLGGLLAGVVLNAGEFLLSEVILDDQWDEAIRALNLSEPCTCVIVAMVVMMFLVGIYTVWLYAAIRPRYGAGPRTAVCAGLAVWLIYYLLGFGSAALFGIFPVKLVLIAVAWGVIEMVLAALAGAWLYKEEEPATAASTPAGQAQS